MDSYDRNTVDFLKQLEQEKTLLLQNDSTSFDANQPSQSHVNIPSLNHSSQPRKPLNISSNQIRNVTYFRPFSVSSLRLNTIKPSFFDSHQSIPLKKSIPDNSSISLSQFERTIITQQFYQAIRNRINYNVETFSRQQRNIHTNLHYPHKSCLSRFFIQPSSAMDLHTFIKNLVCNLKYTRCVYVIALIYIDRGCQLNEWLAIDPNNMYRIICICILLAGKYAEDVHLPNIRFSLVTGIHDLELNFLELQFLKHIGFDCFVPLSLYVQYHNDFMKNWIYHCKRN